MKKLLFLVALIIVSIPMVKLDANEVINHNLNFGDVNVKSFKARAYNDDDWIYGSWGNPSHYDSVYGRMINKDYDTGDAHLKLQWKDNGGYYKVCGADYANLEPGRQITCYDNDPVNSWDEFRTNVRWTNIKNSSSSSYYIDTQIEGGYNTER